MTLLLAVLVASLVGSPHCAGMCGPFVCFYAAGPGTSRGSHVAYNLGRLVSYTFLGALAGALGAQLDAAGELTGISRGAAVVSGTLMIAWGASQIAASFGLRTGVSLTPLPVKRAISGVLKRLQGQPASVRAGATGLLTTLLPCGWLHAFVATAAGTGRALTGVAVMVVFWLGTLPALIAVGAGVQRLAGGWARRLPVWSATALVVLGLLSVSGRLSMHLVLPEPASAAPAAASMHGMSHGSASANGSHEER